MYVCLWLELPFFSLLGSALPRWGDFVPCYKLVCFCVHENRRVRQRILMCACVCVCRRVLGQERKCGALKRQVPCTVDPRLEPRNNEEQGNHVSALGPLR